MPQLYEGGGGSEEDDAANPGVTDDDDLPQEEEEAKLPTLKDKVKKLKNNVPLGKNKNNAASEDDATDDDALFSQRGVTRRKMTAAAAAAAALQARSMIPTTKSLKRLRASNNKRLQHPSSMLPKITENQMFTLATTPQSGSRSSSHMRWMSP